MIETELRYVEEEKTGGKLTEQSLNTTTTGKNSELVKGTFSNLIGIFFCVWMICSGANFDND